MANFYYKASRNNMSIVRVKVIFRIIFAVAGNK
jgi:hypothetical protein